MTDERVYWIWMQQAFLPGSRKPMKIHSQYAGGVKEFCLGGPKLWNTRRDLTDKEAAGLAAFSPSMAEARLEYALRMGWGVHTPSCPSYPERLLHIPNPPAVLYTKGEMPDFDRMLPLAVVGARSPLKGVDKAAWVFGYQLALGGACVVSGEAGGVDSAALTGAMNAPGSKCVCVLPVSLESGYLTSSDRLRKTVVERGGILVTEYFSQENPFHGTFPLRNRLITGLSTGVVLVQAKAKSGTMLYASSALDQNRDVFVYPGPEGLENSPAFAGSASLIRDGAKAVYNGEEVLADYSWTAAPRPARPKLKLNLPIRPGAPAPRAAAEKPASQGQTLHDVKLSAAARQTLDALGPEPLSIGELEEKTGLAASTILSAVTELEVEGLARSLPGKRYTSAF